MIMSSDNVKPKSDVATVEELISHLEGLPVRSVYVARNLYGGQISGEYDDPDDPEGAIYDEIELAAPVGERGMTYLLIGLGDMPSEFPAGINPAKD